MLVPKHHRQFLKSIGHWHLLWYPVAGWAYGKRFKFKNGVVVYLHGDEIVSLRHRTDFIWRKEYVGQTSSRDIQK